MITKLFLINCLVFGISSLFIEKNWSNTCNSVLCNNAITSCIEQNCIFDTCSACLQQILSYDEAEEEEEDAAACAFVMYSLHTYHLPFLFGWLAMHA